LLLYTFFGELRTQVGNRGFHSFAGCFKSKDRWITINPATNGIWKRFSKVIGHPEMARDPRFETDMDRFKNTQAIDTVVGPWVAEKTSEECIAILDKGRIPCSIVNTIDEALNDPQIAARDMIKNLYYPALGALPVPGLPIKLSASPGSIDSPAPALGEHNKEVYCGLLAFDEGRLARLKQEGII
jgi:crotonobetainyl-CoA:carnitine CoA-transferase CaiB-like acyl-CoA transferase